ncbi:membrane protein YczE [Cellulosimicrobium marinum]|uniref:membrane protein YczE n=1 Tax=Cellulosimicrobium marinum TaxID=1638992 RepID=UPI001E474A2C|nr:hypothetical protein [Cellulosimicrobium marinum]MCB7135497.1 hypothetical protein [Cellulosimicrobium marinum]
MSPTRRTAQLFLGLLAYALSMALLLHAGQGGMPWDVLHQGVVRRTGLPYGVVVASLSAVALAAWVPLRQRPGWGTLANVVVIGVTIDPALALVEHLVPTPAPAVAVAMALAGVLLNGLATSAYLGVRLGPGPRDGLMTGLVARTGRPVRLVRTVIEVVVVSLGWALGGTLGWATVVYALGVGPVVQATARWFAPRPVRVGGASTTAGEAPGRRMVTPAG